MSDIANRQAAATSQPPSSSLVAEGSGEFGITTPEKQVRSTARTSFKRQQSAAESEGSATCGAGGIDRVSTIPLAHLESESGEDRTCEDKTWNQGSFGSTLSANTTTGSLLQPPTPCGRMYNNQHHHVAEEDECDSIADEMLNVVGAVVASNDTHSAPYSPTQRMPALSPTKVSPWSTPAHRTTTARGGGNYHQMTAQSWGSADLSAFDTISHATPKGTPHGSPAAVSTTSGPLHNGRSRGSLCGDEWRGISPTNPSPYTMDEMSSSVYTASMTPYGIGTTPATATTTFTRRRESDVIPSSLIPPTVVMLGAELEDASTNDGFATPESSGVDGHHHRDKTVTSVTGLKLWTSPTDDLKQDRRGSCGSGNNTVQPTASLRKVVALRTKTPASQGSSLNQSCSRSIVNASQSTVTPTDTNLASGRIPSTSGGLPQNSSATTTAPPAILSDDSNRRSSQHVKHVISGEDLCALVPEGALSPNRRKSSAHYTSILLGKPISSDPDDERVDEEPSPIAFTGETPPRTPLCGARSFVLSNSSPPVSSMSSPLTNITKERGNGGGSEGALSPSHNNMGGSRGFTTTSTTNSKSPYHTSTTMLTLMQGGYRSMKNRTGSMSLNPQHLTSGYGAAESGEYLDSLAVSPCTPTYPPNTPYGVNTANTDQCVGFGSRRSSGTWSRGPTFRQAGEMGSITCSLGSLGETDTPHMWGYNGARLGQFSPHVREETKAHEEIHALHQLNHRSSMDAFAGMLISPISLSSGPSDQHQHTSTECFSPDSIGGDMSPAGPPTACRRPTGSRFTKSPRADLSSPVRYNQTLLPPLIAPIPLGTKSARGHSPTTTHPTTSASDSVIPMRSISRAEGVPRPIESETMRASESVTTLPPLPASPSKLGLGDRSPARGPHHGSSGGIPPLYLSPSQHGAVGASSGTVLFGGNDSFEDDSDAVVKFTYKSARRESQCSDSSDQYALANTVTSDRGDGGIGMPPLPLSPPTKFQQSHHNNDHSFTNQHLHSPPACRPQWPLGGDETGHGGIRSGSHSRTQSHHNLRTSSHQRGGGSYLRNPVPEEQPNRNPFSTLRPQMTSPSISTPRNSVLSPGRTVQHPQSRPTTGPGGRAVNAFQSTSSITSALTGECSPRSPCTSPSSHSQHHPSSMGFVFPFQQVGHTPLCRSGLSSPRSQSAPCFQIPQSTAHMVLGANHFAPQSSVQNSSFNSTSAVNSHNISIVGPMGHHHQAPSTASGIGGGRAMPPLYPNSHGSSNNLGGGALPHSQWGSLSSGGMALGVHNTVNLSGTGGVFTSLVSELASASSSYSGGSKPHVYAIADHHQHSSSSHSHSHSHFHPANHEHIQRSNHLSFSAADDSPRENRTSVMSIRGDYSPSLHPLRGHPLAQLATPASSAHAAIVLYEQWIPPMVAVAEAQKHPSACASRTHSHRSSRLHNSNTHNNSSQHLRHSVCSSGDGGSMWYVPRRSGGSRLTPHTDSLSPAISPYSQRKPSNLDFGVNAGVMQSADDSFSASTGNRRKSIASFSSCVDHPSQLPGIGAHQLVSIVPGGYPSGGGSGMGVVASGGLGLGARKLSLQQYQAVQSTVAKGPAPHYPNGHCGGSESDTPTPIAFRAAPSGTGSVEEGTHDSIYRSNVSAQLFGSDDHLDGRGGAGGGNHHSRGLSFESAKMQASWEADDHQLHQQQPRHSQERHPFRSDAEDVEDAMDQVCSTAAGSPLAGAGGLVGFESTHRHRNPQLSTSIRSNSLNMPSATFGNTSLNTSSCFATTMGRSEVCGSLGQSLRRGVVSSMAEVSSPLGCTSPLTRKPLHQHLWESPSRDRRSPPSMPTATYHEEEVNDSKSNGPSSPWSPNPNHSPIEREATDDRSPLTPINTTPSPLPSSNTIGSKNLSTTDSGRNTNSLSRTPPPADFSGKSLMGHYDSDLHPHSIGLTQSDSDSTIHHHQHHVDPSNFSINVAGYEDRSFGSPQQANPPSTGAHRVARSTSRLHNAELESNSSSATFRYNRTNSNSCCVAVPLARPLESGGLKSVATAPHLDEHVDDSDDASSYCSSSIIDDELDNNNNTESSEEIEDSRATLPAQHHAAASSPPQFTATGCFHHSGMLGRSGTFGGSCHYSGSPRMMGHKKSFLGGGGGGDSHSMGRLVDKFKARLQLSHFVPWLQRWSPIPVHGDVNGTIWVGNSLIDGLPNLVKEVPCVPHIHRHYEKLSGGNFNTPDKDTPERAGFSSSLAAADFNTPSRRGLPGPSGSLGDGTNPCDFTSPVNHLHTNFADVLRAESNTTPLCPTWSGMTPFATVNATPTRQTPMCHNPVCTPSGTPSGRGAVSAPNSNRISREAAILQRSLQGRAITPPTIAYPISATEKVVPLQLRLELIMLSLAGQHATNGSVRVPVYNITSDALPENIYAANTDLCASAIVSPALRSSIPAYLTTIEHTKKLPLSLCKDADQYFIRLQSVYRSVKSGNFILSTEYPLAPLHEVFLPAKLSTGKEHRLTTRLVRSLKDAAEGHIAPLETLMNAYLLPFKPVLPTPPSASSTPNYSSTTVARTIEHLAKCISYSINTLRRDTSAYCEHIVKGTLPQGGPSSLARLVSDTFGALRTVHACDYLHGCPTTHSIFTKGTPPTGDSSDLSGVRFKLGNFGSVVPNPGSYAFPLECSNHTPSCVAHRSFAQLFPHVPTLYLPQLDVVPAAKGAALSPMALYPAVERFTASLSLMHLICRRFAASILPSALLTPPSLTTQDADRDEDESDILSPNFSPIPQSCGSFPKGTVRRSSTRKSPRQSLRVALHTLLTLLPSAASECLQIDGDRGNATASTANNIHQFQRILVSVFISICDACPEVVCSSTSTRLLNEVATFLGQDIRGGNMQQKSSSSAAESADVGDVGDRSALSSLDAKKGHNAPMMQYYHDELATCLREQESTVDERLQQLLRHVQELRRALGTRSPRSKTGDAPPQHPLHTRVNNEEHDDSSNSSHCDVVLPSDTSYSSCTALGNGLLSSLVSPTTHPVNPIGYSHKSSNLFSPSTMPLPFRNNTFSDIPVSISGGMTPPTTRTTSSLVDGESPNSHYQRHLNSTSSTSGGVAGAPKALFFFSPPKNASTPEGTSAAVSNAPSYQRPTNNQQAARQLLTNTSSGSSTAGTPWSLRHHSSSTGTTPRHHPQQRATPQAASSSPVAFASPSRLPLRGGSGLRTASRMMDEAMASSDNQLFKETISAANEMISRTVESGHASMFPHRYDLLSQMLVGAAGRRDGIAMRFDKALETKPEQRPRI